MIQSALLFFNPLGWMAGPRRYRSGFCTECCGLLIYRRHSRLAPSVTNSGKTMMTKCIASLLLVLSISGSASSALAQKRKSTVDMIVSGGTVVTMDGTRRVIENGGVAIKNGRIVAVDNAAAIERNYAAREVVNATGIGVIAGLINGHTHVPMTLFLGLADELALQEWLS